MSAINPDRPTSANVAASWWQELPDVPTRSIVPVALVKDVATRLRRERERELHALGVDAAPLDLRSSGSQYALSTRSLAERTLVAPLPAGHRLVDLAASRVLERDDALVAVLDDELAALERALRR